MVVAVEGLDEDSLELVAEDAVNNEVHCSKYSTILRRECINNCYDRSIEV